MTRLLSVIFITFLLYIFSTVLAFSAEENFLLVDGKSGDNLLEIGPHIHERVTPYKAGIRIYYARAGQRLLLIIGGGDKRSQERDIVKAKKYLEDYKRRIS